MTFSELCLCSLGKLLALFNSITCSIGLTGAAQTRKTGTIESLWKATEFKLTLERRCHRLSLFFGPRLCLEKPIKGHLFR